MILIPRRAATSGRTPCLAGTVAVCLLVSSLSWTDAARAQVQEVSAPQRAGGFASEPEVLKVLESLEGRRPRSPRKVASDLAALGRTAVPLVLREYWRVRSYVAPEDREAKRPPAAVRERRQQALELALHDLPLGAIHDHLVELCGEAQALTARLAALRTLETFGDASSVSVVHDLIKPLPSQMAKVPPVGPAFRSTMEKLIARDRRALAAVDSLFRRLDPGLRDLTVEAIGKQRSARALRQLTGLLSGRDPRLDVCILQEMKKMPQMALEAMPSRQRDHLRRRLRHRKWAVRLASAEVLLTMKDQRSFLDVVELLDKENARVRRRVLKGLQAATGMRILAEGRRWRNWHDDEMDWVENDGQKLIDDVASGETARALSALRRLSGHAFIAPVVGRELVDILRESEPELQKAAFSVLAGLGATWSYGLLVESLESPTEVVAQSAHAALVRLTGEKHDAKSRAWREQLDVWKGR